MKAVLKIIIGLVVAAGIGVGIYFAVSPSGTDDLPTTTSFPTTFESTAFFETTHEQITSTTTQESTTLEPTTTHEATTHEQTTHEQTTTETATTHAPTTLDPSGYPPRPEPQPDQPYEWFWKNDEESPLEKYVNKDDGHFKWELMSEKDWDNDTVPFFNADNFKAYSLKVTSQKWLNENITTNSIWEHEVLVFVPITFESMYNKTALVYIDGGTNPIKDGTNPYYELGLMMKLAGDLGTIGVVVRQIPNEKMQFYDDHYSNPGANGVEFPDFPPPCTSRDVADEKNGPKHRGEDSIIAYTWWKFMEEGGGDEWAEWLLRFPMTKAVVKSIDAASEFIEQKHGVQNKIENVMVAGASKRGWTTWTVGAVDPRVRAICPLVMDMLRINKQMHSHYQDLGGWTWAFQDYYWENNTAHLDTPEISALSKHVDPWSYRYRYRDRGIKVYVINTAGDEFFMIDDNHVYFKDMPLEDGQIFQHYLRNAEHSLAGHFVSNQHIFTSLQEFFIYTFHEEQFETPKVTFEHWTETKTIQQNHEFKTVETGFIRMEADQEPEGVRMYFSRSQSLKRKDFRLDYIGCPDKVDNDEPWSWDSGNVRYNSTTCECPETTEIAESSGTNTKGVCVAPILWSKVRDEQRGFQKLFRVSFKKLRNGGKKYAHAWEGSIEFEAGEHDYFRAAVMEMKFPSVTGQVLPPPYPLIPDNAKPNFDIELFDQSTRGYGLVVNSAFVIVPDMKPTEDCTREGCSSSVTKLV